ncbi:MAG: BirA family biotin operon repressor/biotin-[acetyl-CoA-carboxylase] ligase [Bacteroidia bacterium]
MFVGQSVIFVQEINSTNEYLKFFSKKKELVEGTVVVTSFQTKGKGQHANEWQSEARQNALFSVLLKPNHLTGTSINAMSFLTGLAVRATIQKYLPNSDVKVKWPNDVFVNNKKIAGILIENRVHRRIESVIGIGLNLNQTEFVDLPNATSVKLQSGEQVSVDQVISDCLGFVEKYYLLSKRSDGVKQLMELYVSQLYKLNESVFVDSEPFIITGVDINGSLELSNTRTNKSVAHKEAEIIWN